MGYCGIIILFIYLFIYIHDPGTMWTGQQDDLLSDMWVNTLSTSPKRRALNSLLMAPGHTYTYTYITNTYISIINILRIVFIA